MTYLLPAPPKSIEREFKELNIRYNQCGFNGGHISPNGFICEHCHRRLKYVIPNLDNLLKERERLFISGSIPSLILEVERDKEIAPQKFSDFFNGLKALKKEFQIKNNS